MTRPISRLRLEELTPPGGLELREVAEKVREVLSDLERGDPTARRRVRRKRARKEKT